MQTKVDLKTLRTIALPVGLLGLAASAYGYTINHDAFAVSWLMGWIFWFFITVGSLGWLMIFHLTSGRWGYVLQRPFEAASRLMPVMLLLFLPVVFHLHGLYEWTHPEVVATDKLVKFKQPYLNEHDFITRLGIYFAIWTVLAYSLSSISRKPTSDGNAEAVKKLRVIAAPGLVLFGLASTFASFDWLMSLEPHWFSSIYGAIFMVASGLTTMLFMAVLANHLSRREPLNGVITAQQFHDIGNWCFAFTILWTYMNFAQFLIIWSGNLYEETFWYLKRSKDGWIEVSILMAVLLFAIPFLFLLFKSNKRKPGRLASIALFMFLARMIDVYWLIGPTFRKKALDLHWMDATAFLGIGGIWLWLFALGLRKEPLLSGDARFTEFAKGSGDVH